jgi:hypothetical protein
MKPFSITTQSARRRCSGFLAVLSVTLTVLFAVAADRLRTPLPVTVVTVMQYIRFDDDPYLRLSCDNEFVHLRWDRLPALSKLNVTIAPTSRWQYQLGPLVVRQPSTGYRITATWNPASGTPESAVGVDRLDAFLAKHGLSPIARTDCTSASPEDLCTYLRTTYPTTHYASDLIANILTLLLVPLLALSIIFLVSYIRTNRALTRLAHATCPSCSYPLTPNSPCPECGLTITP